MRAARRLHLETPLIGAVAVCVLALALTAQATVATGSAEAVRALIASDAWREALEAARALAVERPGAESSAALGEALYRAGWIDEAGDTLAPLSASEEPPPRALAQLGVVRAAQGRGREAVELLERAVAAAPDDPWVVYRAAGAARTRARAVELLGIYIEKGAGEDRDRLLGARGTMRVFTALGEREVWRAVRRPERMEIPLRPLGTGGRTSGYFIEATLTNRKSLRLLLDTGSTGLFVVARAVKKGGFAPLAEETVFAGGGEGRTPSSRGLLEKLSVGSLEFADALCTTTPDEFDAQGRIHGVLGLGVFSDYRVTLDLERGRLTLEPSTGDAAGTPYWDVEGQMLVRAGASGAPDGLFLFDTGAGRSMVALSYAARIPGARTSSAASVRTYGGNVAGAVVVTGASLRFQGITSETDRGVHASDLTQRSRLGGVEISGFLGLDVLAGATIVVDTKARRVAVTPRAKKS